MNLNLKFPVNFAKFARTPFLTEHLPWLLPRDVDDISVLLKPQDYLIKFRDYF